MISVIVPVYNVQSFLKDCVDSIINQTFKNMEIILVDDGSTDDCPFICDEYLKKDNRVKVIHKKNGGLSDARNAGIDIAAGEYITFIDSDDVLEDTMLAYLYELISNAKADMSVCQSMRIDEYGVPLNDKVPVKKDRIIVGNEECMHDFLAANDLGTVAWGKLYKRDLFEDIRYPVGKYHEDVFTTYRLVAKCNRIAIGYEQLYLYRERNQSITQQSFSKKHLDGIYGKLEQAEFIRKNYAHESESLLSSGIIYSANQCLRRIMLSDYRDKDTDVFLQQIYRQYTLSAMTSNLTFFLRFLHVWHVLIFS